MTRQYCAFLNPVYYLVILILTGCATDETRTWHNKTEPQYFEVKEDKLLVQKISYGGKDAELVITGLGIYVLYGKDDAYLNPAYECPYKKFGHTVIEKADQILINCKEGTDNKIHYFHISNAADRHSVLLTIKGQSINADTQSSTMAAGKLISSRESLNLMGISTPDTCIPTETLEKIDQNGGEFHPIMLLHPEVAGATYYLLANPAALLGGALGLALEKAFPFKGPEFSTTHSSLVGGSTDFSIVLAETAKSRFATNVGLISRPCDTSENKKIAKKSELNHNVGTIIRVDSLSGKLFGYGSSGPERYDTELWLFCYYSVLNAADGDVIDTGTVQYVNSEPLNITDESKINDETLQIILQDAYKDMAELLIDNLVTDK